MIRTSRIIHALYIVKFQHLRHVVVNFGTNYGLRKLQVSDTQVNLEAVGNQHIVDLGSIGRNITSRVAIHGMAALVGKNGAGKSTLCKLLSSLLCGGIDTIEEPVYGILLTSKQGGESLEAHGPILAEPAPDLLAKYAKRPQRKFELPPKISVQMAPGRSIPVLRIDPAMGLHIGHHVVLLTTTDNLTVSRESEVDLQGPPGWGSNSFHATTNSYMQRDLDQVTESNDTHHIPDFRALRDVHRRGEWDRILSFLSFSFRHSGLPEQMRSYLRHDLVGMMVFTEVPFLLDREKSIAGKYAGLIQQGSRGSTFRAQVAAALTWAIVFETIYRFRDKGKRKRTISRLLGDPPQRGEDIEQWYEVVLERLLLTAEGAFERHFTKPTEKLRLWNYVKELNGKREWAYNHIWMSFRNSDECFRIVDLARDAASAVVPLLFSYAFAKQDRSGHISQYHFSQGELAFLKLYSRIYDAFLRFEKSKTGLLDEGRVMFLIIDEADLSLHPEWQRNFTEQLVRAIHQGIAGKHVQVLITTHSPILLSDFTPERTTALIPNQQNEESTTSQGQSQTFAANIFDILKDSMFISGSIGSMASRTIRDALAMDGEEGAFRRNQLSRVVADQLLRLVLTSNTRPDGRRVRG